MLIRCIAVLLSIAAIGIASPRVVFAGPQLLSDEELDEISAGAVQFSYSVDPVTGGVNLAFDTGSTQGNGNVTATPSTGPSTVNVTNGNLVFSNSAINVQNMILNLNLCVQCKATTINQIGFGLGINVNP